MAKHFVEYRGEKMVEGWPEKIQAAQLIATYDFEGIPHNRIPYGQESDDWGADSGSCHDCRVIKGEFHVPGCDAEECPICHGSIFSCDCEKDFDGEDPDA